MAGWNKIQSRAANTGAVATASVTITFTATQPGSLLIAFIFCATPGITITPPAGWKQITNFVNTNPAGGGGQCFYYQGNPGGLTTQQFSFSPNALAVAIGYEYSGEYIIDTPSLVENPMGFGNANGTSWGVGGKTFTEINDLVVIAVGFINNAQLTSTYPAGFGEDSNATTSAASNNACLRSASNANPGVASINIGGLTLSGIPTNGPITLGACFKPVPPPASNGNIGPSNLLVSLFE